MISGGVPMRCRRCRDAGGRSRSAGTTPRSARTASSRSSASQVRARDRRVRHDRRGRPGPGGGVRREGLARPVGRPARPGVRRRRAVPRAGDRRVLRPLARGRRGLRRRRAAPSWSTVDLRRRLRVRHPDGRARRGRGPRARSAGCRSATSSTARRSTAGSTWSRPATTSTTRRRRCSATPCGGTPSTSRASRRCSRREDGMVKKVKPLHRLSRARDRRLRVPARDRLRGRGVPARGRATPSCGTRRR